jgi:histidinol-phosphate phosphatase family protein
MLDVDLDRFWRFAESRKAAAALLVHPNDHPFDSDLVATDSADRITGFSRWKDESALMRNLASAALYVIDENMLESVEPREGAFDFGRHVFPELLARGETLVAYRSVEYIKDLGTPERLAKVNRDLAIGKVDPARSGRARAAVFLDRDGVLNVERNGVLAPEALELLPGATEGLHQLNAVGLATVVVTNQPFVSHGTLSEATLDSVHAALERDLARGHAFVDAIYYCPHHPHQGYPGERVELKIDCDCRKPKPGMILRAAEDLCLDLPNSWLIGDRTGDIAAAKCAGLRAILVRGGHGGNDGVNDAAPDYNFEDLREAAGFIATGHPAMTTFCEDVIAGKVTPGAQILVGGLSRSGKSTFSRALAEVLAKKGFEPIVLSLDCWLKDLRERGAGVIGRYNLPAVEAVLAALRENGGAGDVVVPVYDRSARQKVGDKSILLPRGAVAICEGAPALALKAPGALRVALTVNVDDRRVRFDRFYQWRGEEAEAELYWRQREQDETPALLALNDTAEFHYESAEVQP